MAAIMLIHGAFCSKNVWRRFETYLRDRGHEPVSLQLPYHDRRNEEQPQPQLATQSLDDVCDYVMTAARRLTPPFFIVGHSFGGFHAQLVAKRLAREAIHVAGLVCLVAVGPAAVDKSGTYAGFLLSWKNLLRWRPFAKPWKADRRKSIELMMNLLPESLQHSEADDLRWESARATTDWAKNRRGVADIEPGEIPCRLLFVAAEHDLVVRASYVKRVADYYGPKADFHCFTNRDHWLIAGPGWEDVAALSLAWIERQATGAAGAATANFSKIRTQRR